jgi:hypothetical protein
MSEPKFVLFFGHRYVLQDTRDNIGITYEGPNHRIYEHGMYTDIYARTKLDFWSQCCTINRAFGEEAPRYSWSGWGPTTLIDRMIVGLGLANELVLNYYSKGKSLRDH